MTRDEAIRAVAWEAIREAAELVEWENFPDIGEHDWTAIEQQVMHAVNSIKPIHLPFRKAYDLLASEADHDV